MLPDSCKAPAVCPGGQGWEGKCRAWETGPGVSSAPGSGGSGSPLSVSVCEGEPGVGTPRL